MKRRTYRQRDRTPRSMRPSYRYRTLDGLAMSTHDDLTRRIVVCDSAYLTGTGSLGSNRLSLLDVETEQRRHRSVADGNGLLHRAAALSEQARRVSDRDRTGRRQCRVFAER